MRAIFEPQFALGHTPIGEIKLAPRSRDDIPAVLRGLQDTFTHRSTPIALQTVIDNVRLLTEETLQEVNAVVVARGHQLLKHRKTDSLRCRADSAVAKTPVHWPTDVRLLWDALLLTASSYAWRSRAVNGSPSVGWTAIVVWTSSWAVPMKRWNPCTFIGQAT